MGERRRRQWSAAMDGWGQRWWCGAGREEEAAGAAVFKEEGGRGRLAGGATRTAWRARAPASPPRPRFGKAAAQRAGWAFGPVQSGNFFLINKFRRKEKS